MVAVSWASRSFAICFRAYPQHYHFHVSEQHILNVMKNINLHPNVNSKPPRPFPNFTVGLQFKNFAAELSELFVIDSHNCKVSGQTHSSKSSFEPLTIQKREQKTSFLFTLLKRKLFYNLLASLGDFTCKQIQNSTQLFKNGITKNTPSKSGSVID